MTSSAGPSTGRPGRSPPKSVLDAALAAGDPPEQQLTAQQLAQGDWSMLLREVQRLVAPGGGAPPLPLGHPLMQFLASVDAAQAAKYLTTADYAGLVAWVRKMVALVPIGEDDSDRDASAAAAAYALELDALLEDAPLAPLAKKTNTKTKDTSSMPPPPKTSAGMGAGDSDDDQDSGRRGAAAHDRAGGSDSPAELRSLLARTSEHASDLLFTMAEFNDPDNMIAMTLEELLTGLGAMRANPKTPSLLAMIARTALREAEDILKDRPKVCAATPTQQECTQLVAQVLKPLITKLKIASNKAKIEWPSGQIQDLIAAVDRVLPPPTIEPMRGSALPKGRSRSPSPGRGKSAVNTAAAGPQRQPPLAAPPRDHMRSLDAAFDEADRAERGPADAPRMADLRSQLHDPAKLLTDMAIEHGLSPHALPPFDPSGAARIGLGNVLQGGTEGLLQPRLPTRSAYSILRSIVPPVLTELPRDNTSAKTYGTAEPKPAVLLKGDDGQMMYKDYVDNKDISAQEFSFAHNIIVDKLCSKLRLQTGIPPLELSQMEIVLRQEASTYLVFIVQALMAHPNNNADILRWDAQNRFAIQRGPHGDPMGMAVGAGGFADMGAFQLIYNLPSNAGQAIQATHLAEAVSAAGAAARAPQPARKEAPFRGSGSSTRGGRGQSGPAAGNAGNRNGRDANSQTCNQFNNGTCTRGGNCRFAHKCSVPGCNATDHGAHQHGGRNGGAH